LRRTIIQYSSVLFRTEAAEYPAAPELELWLSGLVERVIEKVMTIVAKMNQTSFDYIHGKQYLGLSWHGLTLEEMQEAARQGLEDDKAAVLRRLQPDSAQDIVLQDSESGQIIIGESPAQVGGIVERRDKLLEEYKAATGNPSNKQIYDGSMHFTQRARVARETLKGVLYGNCRGHPLTLA
jgi:hypothetical protein